MIQQLHYTLPVDLACSANADKVDLVFQSPSSNTIWNMNIDHASFRNLVTQLVHIRELLEAGVKIPPTPRRIPKGVPVCKENEAWIAQRLKTLQDHAKQAQRFVDDTGSV